MAQYRVTQQWFTLRYAKSPMAVRLETVFSVRSTRIATPPNNKRTVGSGVFYWVRSEAISLDSARWLPVACVEVGSNISNVALRVEATKREPSAWGMTRSPCSWWGRNTGTWPSRLGGSRSYESRGKRTWEWLRWRGPAAILNDRHILSSERTPHINKPATVWQ
jgi:hypothetical protein